MLHEILLSLSGHPSPLLRNDYSDPAASSLLSPPERQLLDTAAHLSELHCNLKGATSRIRSSHPSAICRAVASAVSSVHLGAFQRKILEVEDSILRKDAALVGAYNIVPLTAVVSQFSDWTRRLKWLWDLIEFVGVGVDQDSDSTQVPCQAAKLINRLRNELQTGYADVYETAQCLVGVAETAWLKQVAAWVLYGRRPTVSSYDFFIREDEEEEHGYSVDYDLLPSFVSPQTAESMLFIGVSINRARSRAGADTGASGLGHLASQHQELALPSPLNGVAFSRAITSIRYTLSRTTLQKLLPLVRVVELLRVLREFFLIGRGEFAIALTQQADERIRGRWRRADNLAYEKRDTLGTVTVKEGEVAAVLARTWAFLGSMQNEHVDDEDEALEQARDLLRLHVSKTTEITAAKGSDRASPKILHAVVSTPFCNLLFSVPVKLTMQIQSPLDLFLTHSDLQIYTAINSYLLSIRRAHLRLTDLWKITSLRRNHPPPPKAPFGNTKAGIAKTKLLRERWSLRSSIMRSTWSTSSAAIFFLGETEAYLQVEVVEGLWSHFHSWVTGTHQPSRGEYSRCETSHSVFPAKANKTSNSTPGSSSNTEDAQEKHHHDPQTLSTAHRQYLSALVRRLLLTQHAFCTPLHELLIQIDHLVALVHRLHGVWTSLDLEADEGVVDAFSNLDAEERDVRSQLRGVERRVKFGIENVVAALRALSLDSAFAAEMEGEDDKDEDVVDENEAATRYRPRRVGGIDRLLMKLDFGGWFGPADGDGAGLGAQAPAQVHARGDEFA
ncbi:Spc97/Spc98 family protein [Astrocystis sublimbata]|nr:Spc97/Spc98 family protein [Astrocystis sublimbata]